MSIYDTEVEGNEQYVLSAESFDGLRVVQRAIYVNAKEKGFHDVGRRFGDAVALILTELGEAFEAYRTHGMNAYFEETEYGAKPCGVGSELADVVIRCLDIAEEHRIDLASVIEAKMAYNRKRPAMHGNKQL
ncbi:MAG: hypothetical protein OXL41_03895 [Nitrospinae bacterium]|nr:hypothetical protein [Nitrospinota bacterium]